MPLLGGLFTRKNKPSPHSKRDENPNSVQTRTTISELDSVLSSPTASSFILPANSISSNPNASGLLHPDSARKNVFNSEHSSSASHSPNTSKLRLPFSRKKSNIIGVDLTADPSASIVDDKSKWPAQPTIESIGLDSAESRRLRPPPSRSAIFAAYGDPNSALSTRSLPNDPTLTSIASEISRVAPPQPPQKRPSIFPWRKHASSLTPQTPPRKKESPSASNLIHDLSNSPTSQDANSFNLKSFRHVRPPSPTRSTASHISMTPPVSRPRGPSINSDSSQRISVAAFREAQARRSLAGSPSPSFRSPSPVPPIPREISPATGGRGSPRPTRSSPSIPHATQHQRQRSMVITYTSESGSSSSSSESEEESQDEQRSVDRPLTFGKTGRVGMRAKSDMGHGDLPDASSRSNDRLFTRRPPRSDVGHSFSPSSSSRQERKTKKLPEVPPRSQSSLSQQSVGIRQRASVSASALSPSAAAKRASDLLAANKKVPTSDNKTKSEKSDPSKPALTPPTRSLVVKAGSQAPARNSQVSSDSDSEDNAPLASLIGPKRPGSAMSSYSNRFARSTGNVTSQLNTHLPPKPLIDIKELTAPKRSLTSSEKDSAAFTEGPTLLSQTKPSFFSQKPLVESPTSIPTSPTGWPPVTDDKRPLIQTTPPVNFISRSNSPAPKTEQFVAKTGSQATQGLNSISLIPNTNSEKRDPITDRLTKIVKQNLSQNESVVAPAPTSPTKCDASPNSRYGSGSSQTQRNVLQAPTPANRQARAEFPPSTIASTKDDHSPPDQELAQLLGTAGIKFISRTGETESEDTSDDEEEEDEEDNQSRIAPIPIKERSPPPAFSVTSRPPLQRFENTRSPTGTNQRTMSSDSRPLSSISVDSSPPGTFAPRKPATTDSNPASMSTNFASGKATPTTSHSSSSSTSHKTSSPGLRQRTATMLTGVPLSTQMPKTFRAPEKPFAVRRNSPASSTGDSSNGVVPLTPQDGSDIGVQDSKKKNRNRRSVSFEDDLPNLKPPSRLYLKDTTRSGSDAGDTSNDDDREHRRRERRRSEAKAAIELGNVINGRGPILDDDDEDMPLTQTVNSRMLNPMMGMANPMPMQMGFGASPGVGWGVNMGQPMLSPAQYMAPPPADPNFMAAHQHAMLIAKQAYQMAVAQQAMAAAADEWERGSAVGGYGGSAVGGYGGGSVYGGSAPSMMGAPFGVMGMMQGGGGWPSSASVYGGTRSMYGGSGITPGDGMISSSRSEYGGGVGRNQGNWSSPRSSSYGEYFGPSPDQSTRKALPAATRRSGNQSRDFGYLPAVPPIPASQSGSGRSSPDSRGNPRMRTASQPSSPGRAAHKSPPPSSWKAGM